MGGLFVIFVLSSVIALYDDYFFDKNHEIEYFLFLYKKGIAVLWLVFHT